MSDFALQALIRLRDGSNFQWYVIPLLAFVFYVYTVEAEKRNWNLVLAGLAFWGADWLNEILNSLVFRFTGYAPIWAEPGPSAYLILIGLNIETMFMFAVAGIVWTKMLHPDKDFKYLGIPIAGQWRSAARYFRSSLNISSTQPMRSPGTGPGGIAACRSLFSSSDICGSSSSPFGSSI